MLSVSLQGSEKNHDSIRGAGSYVRTIRGIKTRRGSRYRSSHLHRGREKRSLPNSFATTDSLYKIFPGIHHLSLIQLIRVTNDVFDLSHELLDPEDFLLLVRTVSLLNLFGFKTDVMNNPLAGVAAKILETPWISRSKPLYRPGSIISLGEPGHLPFPFQQGTFSVSTLPGMIREVLTSNSYRRAVSPNESTCGRCRYVDLCRAEGMDRPSEWFRDMNPETPYCKRVLDEASR